MTAGLLLVFCTGLAVSGYKVLSIVSQNRQAASAYSELRVAAQSAPVTTRDVQPTAQAQPALGTVAEVPLTGTPHGTDNPPTPPEPTAAPHQRSLDFATLQESAPNIVAWITAQGTSIDYPVMHTDDNDYYLTHLYNGEPNRSGSIYVDYRNSGSFTERNTVIYGHLMKNGTMFNALEEFKAQDFYDTHPTMTLFTPDGDYLIELVSGTVENGDREFVRFDLADDESVRQYVQELKARSTFESNVDLQPGDRLVSLLTCSYERANARYMVVGRLVALNP
ncbi:MAG: class B sortase [Anaerolineae bacterium]